MQAATKICESTHKPGFVEDNHSSRP